MLRRIALALLRSPIILLYAVLCLGLSLIGFTGAYLLLTLGLQILADDLTVWLMAGFGVAWGCFWLYLLGVALRAAMDDET
jgi:hypothetical protein